MSYIDGFLISVACIFGFYAMFWLAKVIGVWDIMLELPLFSFGVKTKVKRIVKR